MEINALIGAGATVWASTHTAYRGNKPILALKPAIARIKVILIHIVSIPCACAIMVLKFKSDTPSLLDAILMHNMATRATASPIEQMKTYFHVASKA